MEQVRVYFNIRTAEKVITPGVGSDIFVHKNVPGSHVGGGYKVEIFNNGVKVDERDIKTKIEVEKLISEYKEKYNTNRAFQNEVDVHVTYKNKRERGEDEMNSTASIDNTLYTKVSYISDLCNRLLDPSLPLKKYAEDLNTNFVKEPNPLDETPQDNDGIVKQMQKIIDKYISTTEDDEGVQYNAIKGWLGDIKTILHQNNRQGANFDFDYISDKLKEIYLKQDSPGYYLFSKKASFPLTDKLVSRVNKSEGDPFLEGDLKKELSEDQMKEVQSNLDKREDKTEPELKLNYLLNAIRSAKEYDTFIKREAEDCWKFIRSYKGSTTLDNCVSSWLSKKSFSLIDANYIYQDVLEGIDNLYTNHKVSSIDDPALKDMLLIYKYKEAATGIAAFNDARKEFRKKFNYELELALQEHQDISDPQAILQDPKVADSLKEMVSSVVSAYLADTLDRHVEAAISKNPQYSPSSLLLNRAKSMADRKNFNIPSAVGFNSLYTDILKDSMTFYKNAAAEPEKVSALINAMVETCVELTHISEAEYQTYLKQAYDFLKQEYSVGMKKAASNKIEVDPSGKIEIITDEQTTSPEVSDSLIEDNPLQDTELDSQLSNDVDDFISSLDKPKEDNKEVATDTHPATRDVKIDEPETEEDDVFQEAENLQKDIDKGKPKETERTLLDILKD